MSGRGRPYNFSQALTGGSTYDSIDLPERVFRVVIKSKNQASDLNLKFHGESTILTVEYTDVYDSYWVDWQNPTIAVNGQAGTYVDGEYWARGV